MATDELEFLEGLKDTYVFSDSPQDRTIKTLAMRTFRPFIRGPGPALELGCSDGFFTELIRGACADLTVVDGSKSFLDLSRARVPDARFVYGLFEEFQPERPFDYIFASYILEHVSDAVGLLRAIRSWLSPDGLLFLVVPNARAQSRQLAQHMGLIDDLYALTPNDVNHGHRRVYDRVLLDRDVAASGLVTVASGGLMLKPFADFQMDALMKAGVVGPAQIEGLYRMGLAHPEFAGSLFSVCRA